MDPDKALHELRTTFGLIKAHRRMTTQQIEHLAEVFAALDAGLTRGDFLPRDWRMSLVTAASERGGE